MNDWVEPVGVGRRNWNDFGMTEPTRWRWPMMGRVRVAILGLERAWVQKPMMHMRDLMCI